MTVLIPVQRLIYSQRNTSAVKGSRNHKISLKHETAEDQIEVCIFNMVGGGHRKQRLLWLALPSSGEWCHQEAYTDS